MQNRRKSYFEESIRENRCKAMRQYEVEHLLRGLGVSALAMVLTSPLFFFILTNVTPQNAESQEILQKIKKYKNIREKRRKTAVRG